jgi:glucan 1,3-beta-glucosidase
MVRHRCSEILGIALTHRLFTGAQRSQNGYDNSGQLVSTPGWTTSDSVSATENVMRMMAEKYAAPSYQDVVVAIELLNEPLMSELAGGEGATRGYYWNGFQTVRSVSSTSVIIHDGFQNASHWNGFLTGSGAAGAVIDHHEYQCFTNGYVAMSAQEHIATVCSNARLWGEGQDKFVIVGEWSGAMTDCADALVSLHRQHPCDRLADNSQNGYGIGARYDGTYSKRKADGTYDTSTYIGSCANRGFIDQWSQELKANTANYINAQLDVFEQKTQGWIYWNFKTESAAVGIHISKFPHSFADLPYAGVGFVRAT